MRSWCFCQRSLERLARPYGTKTPVGRREPICQDFVAKTLAVTRHNLPRHFSQVSADDVGFGLQAAQHLAGAGDKGGGATSGINAYWNAQP